MLAARVEQASDHSSLALVVYQDDPTREEALRARGYRTFAIE